MFPARAKLEGGGHKRTHAFFAKSRERSSRCCGITYFPEKLQLVTKTYFQNDLVLSTEM